MSTSDSNSEVALQSKPLTGMWCQSFGNLVKFEIEWTITSFDFQESTNFFQRLPATSEEMSIEELPSLKMRLELDQLISNGQNYIALLLVLTNNTTRIIPIRVRPFLMDKKLKKVEYNEQRLIAEEGYSRHICIPGTSSLHVRKSDLLSDEGHLTFFCEIEILSHTTTSSGQKRSGQNEVTDYYYEPDSLDENFRKLFENKMLADVTLRTGGKEFQAHKAILAARSPVFAAMFQQEMKEKVSDQVDVLDIEPDVLQHMLYFIYTGNISLTKWGELATELLPAADKYLLKNLKSKCENYLKDQLTTENCIEFMLLADRHSANNLKQDAVIFFRNKPAKVIASDGWMTAKEKESVWLCEMMKLVFG